jgi:hypothetical protein
MSHEDFSWSGHLATTIQSRIKAVSATPPAHPPGPGGEHAQYSGSGTHSHPGTDGAHVHQVKLPKKMWRIQPGDRVFVAWVNL